VIGRVPTFPAPQFASPYPTGGYVTPGAGIPYNPPPVAWNPPPWNPPPAPRQVPPVPVVRAQMDDDAPPPPRRVPAESRPASFRMPSPQELGVTTAGPADSPAIDWTAVHKQLDRLGATCFHSDQLAAGVYRITCLLPTGESGRSHRVEAQAEGEAEAVRLALSEANAWAAGR
jgi:hypothetical protein